MDHGLCRRDRFAGGEKGMGGGVTNKRYAPFTKEVGFKEKMNGTVLSSALKQG